MSFTVIIPARYGSTRLPGKPLLDIGGKCMVQRVWEQARASEASRIVIATDDARIAEAARGFSAEVCMTDPAHPSGTDRLEEVAAQLHLGSEEIVVNVQGDEPLIPPRVINQVATNLAARPQASVATLCEPIAAVSELLSADVVKVVRDAEEMALYFSRAPIPWPRDAFAHSTQAMPDAGEWFRHIGLYAYRVRFLRQYVTWRPAPQERLESLEQLRALHHGAGIHVTTACSAVPAGVDTATDLEQVRELLSADRAQEEGPA